MSSIVLTGGGTAGHVMPHLAILPQLHQGFDNICYIGRHSGIERELMEGLTDYFAIDTVKFIRSFSPKNLTIPFKLIKSVNQAKAILQKIKPNVVFSKGGFVSLPVVLASHQLNIPVISHESDLSLGLTNKLTANKCKMVLTTFPQTAQKLKNGKFVGITVREQLFFSNRLLALKSFNLTGEKPVLLVMGGSGGSMLLNNLVEKHFDFLTKHFQLIHICGKGNLSTYSPTSSYYKTEFCHDMASAYKACDFILSRGGSNALGEIIALKKPSLIIPLERASRGDQVENATYFENLNLLRTLREKNIENFEKEIENLIKNKNLLLENLKKCPLPFANTKIAEILLSFS